MGHQVFTKSGNHLLLPPLSLSPLCSKVRAPHEWSTMQQFSGSECLEQACKQGFRKFFALRIGRSTQYHSLTISEIPFGTLGSLDIGFGTPAFQLSVGYATRVGGFPSRRGLEGFSHHHQSLPPPLSSSFFPTFLSGVGRSTPRVDEMEIHLHTGQELFDKARQTTTNWRKREKRPVSLSLPESIRARTDG